MAFFRQVVLLICLALLLAVTSSAQDYDALVQQAESFWLERSSSDQYAIKAIGAFTQAAQMETERDTPHFQIARAYYFLGRFAAPAQKEAFYSKGVAAAEKAILINENSIGGFYWYSACMARILQTKRMTEKLKYVKKIKGYLTRARDMDPGFYYGGPSRALGMISFRSPFGSNKEAIFLLRESLQYASEYSLTLVNLAEVLIKEKQYVEARQLCEKVIKLKPKPGFERETANDQALARTLLAQTSE